MANYAKYLMLEYNSAEAHVRTALKTNYFSVRFIRDAGVDNPKEESYVTNILLNGKCIDPETRCLYVFYIDTYYGSAWIIEIKLDSRVQTVVYFDRYNTIGFDQNHKFYNAKVVHGKLVWTDDKNPIYQMDIERAKKSFYYQIGYPPYPNTAEWETLRTYGLAEIVSSGNYFYKSNIEGNIGMNPRLDDGTLWTKLCLIEDAYYSMNIENFYFEAMPPKLAPIVEYVSDDTRRINNLRQTLFQVAYRYVYMDWRRSTISPASIVPVPQSEEESATGLANEQVSLNNSLKITFNTGGEEVRAIEILGRSNDNISKWYLIETINKFDEEERAGEISILKNVEKATITITIPAPTVTSVGIAIPDGYIALAMTIPVATITNMYITASLVLMDWAADEFGDAVKKTTLITIYGGMTVRMHSIPSWINVETVGGLPINLGDIIASGSVIAIYPNEYNTEPLKEAQVILQDDTVFGNQCPIDVTHNMSTIAAGVLVEVHEDDQSGLTLTDNAGSATNGSDYVSVTLTPHHPGYGDGVGYNLNYRIYVNSIWTEGGTFAVNENVIGTRLLYMAVTVGPGDIVEVKVWEGSLS